MTQAYGTYVLAVVGALGAALALVGAGSIRRHRAYVPRYRPGSPSAIRQRALAIHSPVRAIEAGPRPRLREPVTAEYPLPRTDLERGYVELAGTRVEDGPAYVAAIEAMNAADPFADVTDLAEHDLLTAMRAELGSDLAALDAVLDEALQRFRDATATTMATCARWGLEAESTPGVVDVSWRIETDTAEWPLVRQYDTAEAPLVS